MCCDVSESKSDCLYLVRDSVLSKAEHSITIDNQQIKLKVYKPSDVEEQEDRTEPKVSIITKCRIRNTML